jgi:ABC-type antimicrobial peptide transport system permease subunit
VAITAAGLDGVIAFSVNQRRQEFGVRLALGATPGSLLLMVLRLLAVGLVIGGGGALLLGKTLRPCCSTSRTPTC